ncbi:MAG: thiol-disulfide isomerase/thioredoxin [Flavobacteriaceae bacterium]|jgi:thiol-disulfide isomerase/thioredoxin
MKQFFGFLFLLLLVTSCDSDTIDDQIDDTEDDAEVAVDNFTITGAISGANNQTFYLEALSQQGSIPVTSGTSDADGNFSLTGNIPGFGIYQLRIGEQAAGKIIPLTLVPDDKVTIECNIANYEMQPIVSGTSWSESMTGYMAVFSKFHIDQTALMLQKGKISDEELSEKFLALKRPVDNYSINSMKLDPGNPFNIVLSASATPSMGFDTWDPSNLEILKAVSSAYQSKYPDSPMTANMTNQAIEIEKAYNSFKQGSDMAAGGSAAPEIVLNNPMGQQIKLSSLRGKYVLIDFWASWCGPCRKENPNVVKLYNKYKNDGFTVYSVSLDRDKEAWKAAIQKDGLIWPNHVSDLLMWDSPMVQLYGFDGIPHTVLIDPDGNVIGVKLRGASLEQKLKEIFKK